MAAKETRQLGEASAGFSEEVQRGFSEGHSMLPVQRVQRGTQHVAGARRYREIIGVEERARLLNAVSTVRDHRLERFTCRKGTKRPWRMRDVPTRWRSGIERG
jgi:hypothetical protein